ncbi:unnamed protein product [Mytilus coruscus]|uniref:Uncharacterized protein n=1 Tax=Mytilus coruscus TaxID=42192 RepID=A0A6J8E8N1_MYTCO|nr:unnamed protein product [Mytilus coruscus]
MPRGRFRRRRQDPVGGQEQLPQRVRKAPREEAQQPQPVVRNLRRRPQADADDEAPSERRRRVDEPQLVAMHPVVAIQVNEPQLAALELHPDQLNIWALGTSPVNVNELSKLLELYPDNQSAVELLNGFKYGFKIHYEGPRRSYNFIADVSSGGQMKKFREVTSNADPKPQTIPQEFLDVLTSYISGISYKLKIQGNEDLTKFCIIQKLLGGCDRLYKSKDLREPIPIDILIRLNAALRHECSSRYETIMFQTAFNLAFAAFLRVSEFAITSNVIHEHVLHKRDVYIDHVKNQLFVTIK